MGDALDDPEPYCFTTSLCRHRNNVSRFSETLPRWKFPPLEPKSHRIIVSQNNGGTS